ncbi:MULTISPECIES: GTPase-associated protein 1-related protein [unclassified Streptomyces]|uniref:GTPase-associated protein 1-related protein n=1 Tax=unclassified Streptomyces TaxID=2593676 RepID=UPI002256A5FC|nr:MULTISPECIES: GTPase-associated protein 1-related protein [unclassified Streptomyces]MCX4392943.1 GTPase-associated protein 1-related protein [Streptomyces sp. NBC_01767]WSC26942.1 GTPase-associated protein 1-related protein [Streptomyces sp. NBC_01768]
MGLSQLHYTSAPPCPDGSGFRFTAVSPGLPHSVLREAESVIGYEPPRDAPPRPTADELLSFPQAFSFTLLSDGSRLLARTVYTGADYSGRWGNFHAHGVHLPAGVSLPGGALPITAWGSACWSDSTPNSRSPAPLDALPPRGGLDRTGLIDFAVSRGPWLPGFLADLHRQAEDETAPQIVLVERDSASVAFWVALAGATLPRESAHRLTFTTYTRRPQLARQQLIGVLPDDVRGLNGYESRYRIHDCTGRPPASAAPGAWAASAVQIWLNRAPELFARAAELSAVPFAPGPLAVVALLAGIHLETGGRTAAAEWLLEHAESLDEKSLHRLIRMLCEAAGDRTTAETSVLAELFEVLSGSVAAVTIAPLAALGLVEAVRTVGSPLDLSRARALTEEQTQRLAAELAPEIRSGIASTGTGTADGPAASRPVQLLRVAGLLAVDCSDLLPDLVRRLAHALLADPEAVYAGVVHEALHELVDLRTALLDKLDHLAAGDPAAVARLLALVPLPVTGTQALPHLRMCAEAREATAQDGDRVTALHIVLRAAGVSPFAEPLVLRTAFRLVWADAVPSAGDARLVLGETGAAAHVAADTWSSLVEAALNSPADDRDAPDLAHDLLRCFQSELKPSARAALLLLEFARDLRAGTAGSGWTDRALALRAAAGPVRPTVLEQAFGAVARCLLTESRPDGELYAFIQSSDTDLCTAYGRAARETSVRDRLRTVPAYAAYRFIDWSSHPHAGRAWTETRAALLDEVLRPVVRALSAGELAAVEHALTAVGGHWLEDFRSWNRPGAFGRLGLRFAGRGRRAGVDPPRRGNAAPPWKGSRP